MLAGAAGNAAVAGIVGAGAWLTRDTLDAVGTVRTAWALLARGLLRSAMGSCFARRAACPIFGAGFAGGAEDADPDAAVLTRPARIALGARVIRLRAGLARVARDAIHAELVVSAKLAEG